MLRNMCRISATLACRMGCNLAVLLLNKLLLTFWAFKQPVLLTFLHMLSATVLTWGLWALKLLTIQRVQSTPQLLKLASMSLVFALAVLSANVSLKYLAVSMNQAIGAATPVFAAFFAFICQQQIEHGLTYATLLLVVGGVIVASGVEPQLHMFGAFVCFLAAAFRGLRAVLQAILLRPEEKLDSISCLAYMVPVSSVLMLVMCPIVEPAGIKVLLALPWAGLPMVTAVTANCMAAFGSNYFNMAVTKRTSALTIQVRASTAEHLSVQCASCHNVACHASQCDAPGLTSTRGLRYVQIGTHRAKRYALSGSRWRKPNAAVQVLGQCKGVISAVVSVLCFKNVVPVVGWLGYGITVVGCFLYGRCKVHLGKSKKARGSAERAAEKQWIQEVQEEAGAMPLPAGTMDLGSSPASSLGRALSDKSIGTGMHTTSSSAEFDPNSAGLPPRPNAHRAGQQRSIHDMHARQQMHAQGEAAQGHAPRMQSAGQDAARLMHAPHTNHDRTALPRPATGQGVSLWHGDSAASSAGPQAAAQQGLGARWMSSSMDSNLSDIAPNGQQARVGPPSSHSSRLQGYFGS